MYKKDGVYLMRLNHKHKSVTLGKDILNIDFHQFMELEGKSNSMEIAEELGISLRDVHMLRKRINRT